MVRTGLEAQCERCGKVEFFEDEPKFSGNGKCIFEAYGGWGNRAGKHLCPDCLDEINRREKELVEKFFEEKNNEKDIL